MIIGMTITKDEQARAVAAAADITTHQAREALDAIAAVVTVGLRDDGHITLQGLGRFETRRRSVRRVRNPATGHMMDVPAKTIVKFKPAAPLRDSVERI